jgi:hypothetical protein
MGRDIQAARVLAGFSFGLGLTELIAPDWLGKATGASLSPGLLRAYGLREIGAGALTAVNPAAGLWSRVAGDVLDVGTVATRLRTGERKRIAVTLAMLLGVTLLDVWAARQATRRRRGF